MTTFDVTVGRWVANTVVSLPTGSNGDQMVILGYGTAGGNRSGWVRHIGPSSALYAYTKTRAGGESTVTLPFVGAGFDTAYAIISATGVTYDSFDSDLVAVPGPDPAPFTLNETWSREDPRFAFSLLHAGTITSDAGDFTADTDYNDAQIPSNINRSYVADESGPGDLAWQSDGTRDNQGGYAWVVAFFSPPLVTQQWTVGRVRWGDATGAWR